MKRIRGGRGRKEIQKREEESKEKRKQVERERNKKDDVRHSSNQYQHCRE